MKEGNRKKKRKKGRRERERKKDRFFSGQARNEISLGSIVVQEVEAGVSLPAVEPE